MSVDWNAPLHEMFDTMSIDASILYDLRSAVRASMVDLDRLHDAFLEPVTTAPRGGWSDVERTWWWFG